MTNEVRVTKKANHQNIIELYNEIESEHSLYLVLECADGGELFDMIVTDGRFSEPVAKVYFLQMLNAVKYLHSIQITHRDLKPENILIDEDHKIKLIDFGLCAQPDTGIQTTLSTCCGSPAYAAPELGMYTMNM